MINSKQRAVIDRIVDGAFAVLLLEGGQQITVPMEELPPGSREGIWLLVRLVDGNLVEAELDLKKTAKLKNRLKKSALIFWRACSGMENERQLTGGRYRMSHLPPRSLLLPHSSKPAAA